MALLHEATLEPSKLELVGAWLRTRTWAGGEAELELIGAYRFDDPEGQVGMETFLVRRAGAVVQVPVTYRDAPLAGAEAGLIGTTEHSELGTRWVYDGAADPTYVRMLAIVTITGVGQSVEVFFRDGRARTRAPTVRLSGSGWLPVTGLQTTEVDGWAASTETDGWCETRSPERVLRLARLPRPALPAEQQSTTARLLGSWPGIAEPVLLATVEPTVR